MRAVCADASEIDALDGVLFLNGYTNVSLTNDCSLAVPEVSLVDSIRFYPNPTHDIVNIQSNSIIGSIVVFDVQ